MPQPNSKKKTEEPRVRFLGGVVKARDLDSLKLETLPCFVFSGRSNVGKSSLLNALTGSKLARVSAEPGKTREMNFYRFMATRAASDACHLVDLPGYGYAKVARQLKAQWGAEITTWLKSDHNVSLIFALVDGRHGYLENDVELIEFLAGHNLPFVVVFTKMDKYKSNNQRKQAERDLAKVSEKLGVDRFIFTSTQGKEGIHSLEETLREVLKSHNE